jgi:hypothetical protein
MKIRDFAVTAAALSVAIFFSVASWVVWQARSIPLHVNGVLTRAEGVESKLNASAINLDKATAAWSSSAKTQADAITGLVTDAHGSLSEVDQTLAGLRSNSAALNGNLASLRTMTDEAAITLSQARADLVTLNGSIGATQPLVEAYTRSGDDLDKLLRSSGLNQTIAGLGVTSTNMGAITGDFETKFHAILFPSPCKTFGCRLTKEIWPAARELPSLGQALYWTHALFTNQKP